MGDMTDGATEMPETPAARLEALISGIYPPEQAAFLTEELGARMQAGPARDPRPLDQRDTVLITYGDSISTPGSAPLATLDAFLKGPAEGLFSAVHILPFYPYSSDDGFSVIDYRAVNPALGDWADVRAIADHHDLMADAVVNHISAESDWFAAFRRGEAPHVDYFTTCDPSEDLSAVTRPRATPLLTPVETDTGVKHVWTTFSADQIDLNYAEPKVVLEVVDLLLFYVSQGARMIRLDAIGFIWKEKGTTCMHLPQAHALIQAMRLVLDAAAPGTILITETNVPHKDNISYFGDGTNEAHMVYQFPLPPLVLHAFHTGDVGKLRGWLADLDPAPGDATFFNFLSSHDGVGVRPVEGILSTEDVAAMADRVRAGGGRVSMRSLPDGSESPYELNATYMDALAHPGDGDATRARRLMAAQTILVSVAGVPAVYVHSLLGTRNDLAGMEETGRARSINRKRLDLDTLGAELARADSLPAMTLAGHRNLLAARRARPGFAPKAAQQVLDLDPRVFSILRGTDAARTLVLVNVSDQPVTLPRPAEAAGLDSWTDPVDGTTVAAADTISLAPYGTLWLSA